MAFHDKLRSNAAHLLQPGETIQAIFPAQRTSAYFALMVTGRRMLVCQSGRFRNTPVKSILRELPRGTRIGIPSGLWWRSDTLGERLYVHRRFHKDVTSADAVLAPGSVHPVGHVSTMKPTNNFPGPGLDDPGPKPVTYAGLSPGSWNADYWNARIQLRTTPFPWPPR